jgi:hypothetical protein
MEWTGARHADIPTAKSLALVDAPSDGVRIVFPCGWCGWMPWNCTCVGWQKAQSDTGRRQPMERAQPAGRVSALRPGREQGQRGPVHEPDQARSA